MRCTTRPLSLLVVYLCLLLCILAACGSTETYAQQQSPQHSARAATTSQHTTPNTNFVAHIGDGYTICYPQQWKFNTNTTNAGGYIGDYFTDPTNAYAFHVYPSQDQTPAQDILQHLLTNDPSSRLVKINPTITINQITWQQGRAVITDQQTGKTFDMLGWVAKNPVKGNHIPYFVLHAEGDPAQFDEQMTTYFLPMLHSFSFKP